VTIELVAPFDVASPGAVILNIVAVDPITIEPMEASREIF